MRPARLEIQGFTCYREKQSIDFSSLRLFAIAGPTGSGKSSMLDAITFALYGRIPRMGGRNLDEFISLGASRASVVLDFQLHGKSYRVVRSMSRSGPKRAQLEEVSEGVERPLADGIRDVDERIGELLALDYEAFTQSVLLPQGEFAKFLKSDPKEQRQIVRDLLRLGVYEEMRKRAADCERELAKSIGQKQSLLNGPYAEATSGNLETTEAELNDLRTRKEAKSEDAQRSADHLQKLRAQWALMKERESRQAEQQQLDRDRPKIESLREAVECSKRARQALPAIEALEAADSELTGARAERSDSEEAAEQTQATLQTQTNALGSAQKKAEDLPALRSRTIQLAAIAPVITERGTCLSRIQRLRAELEDSSVRARREEARKATAQEKIGEFERQRLDKLRFEAAIGYDATRHDLFQRLQRQAIELEQARAAQQQAQQGLEDAGMRLQRAEKDLHSLEEQLEKKDEAFALAATELRASEQSLDEARHANMAGTLRSRLHPGDTCPVCEKTITELPPGTVSADIEAAERTVEAERKAEKAAAASREKANSAVITARSALDSAHQLETQARSALENCRARCAELTQSIQHAIFPLECPASVLIEVFIAGEITVLDTRSKEAAQIREELNRLILEQQKASSEFDTAAQALVGIEQNRLRLLGDIAEGEERVRECGKQIESVGTDDPEGERSQVESQIGAIEKLLRETTELYAKAQEKVQQAQRNLAGSQARVRSAEERQRDAAAALKSVLEETEFPDAKSARNAVLTPKNMTDAEAKVVTFDNRSPITAKTLEVRQVMPSAQSASVVLVLPHSQTL